MKKMLTTSPLNYPKATAPKVSLFQPSNAGASSRQGRGQGNNSLLWLRVVVVKMVNPSYFLDESYILLRICSFGS